MKFKELKTIADECNYTVDRNSVRTKIFNVCNTIEIGETYNNYICCHEDFKTLDFTDIKILEAAIKYAKTPLAEREYLYIIPLPLLKTTDGEQQYLTYKDKYWFACRRPKDLKQLWLPFEIMLVLEEYRKYAVKYEL